MPTPQRTRSHIKKKKAFVELLRNGSTVLAAAKVVGISRRHMYELKEADAEFSAEWDEAYSEAQEAIKAKLEAEADRRATGYLRELSFKGLKTGDTITEYSDNLLMFRLKKLDPSYRDNAKIEVNVGDRLDEWADAITGKDEEPDEAAVPEKGSSTE